MRIRTALLLAAIGLCAGLLGCSTTSSTHLVGTRVTEDLSKELNGVFRPDDLFGGQVFHVRYAGEGRVVIAGVEWKEDGFELETLEGVLTTHEGVRYIHFPEYHEEPSPPGEPERYTFWRLVLAQEAIVVISPNHELFARALERGELAGTVERSYGLGTNRIEGDKAAVDDFIAKDAAGAQFYLEDPVVFTRLVPAR